MRSSEVLAIVLSLVVRSKAFVEGEVVETHLYQHPYVEEKSIAEYPWVVSLVDRNTNGTTCTANVILAHLSLTTCDCLALPVITNDTGRIDLKTPGERYVIVGGIVDRNDSRSAEELETKKFIIYDECSYSIFEESWIANYGLIVHDPFRKTFSLTAPMPMWSSTKMGMEWRYQEIIARGEPCYLIGWLIGQHKQVKITVKIYEEPLPMVKLDSENIEDCIRVSCLESNLEIDGTCSATAVSCTTNRSVPYRVESGMPLVCGTTGEVFAISESPETTILSNIETDKDERTMHTHLWKLASVIEWLQLTTANELQARSKEQQEESPDEPN